MLDHLCIDCTCCIAACDPGALDAAETPPDGLTPAADAVLAVPPALLAGFADHAAATVLDELRGLGFGDVVRRRAVRGPAAPRRPRAGRRGAAPRPDLAVCPAVVELVEVRFPSLVPHLAPFASPWEALPARPRRGR